MELEYVPYIPFTRGMQGKKGCTYAVHVARKRSEKAHNAFCIL